MSTQRQFSQSLFNSATDVTATFKIWNQSDPTIRLNVYRNNIVVTWLDALAETFPVTQELVGEVFFREMARVFIQQHPPNARELLWLGRTFPDFVETFEPAAEVRYLADVARLEIQRLCACHARDASPIGAEALQTLFASAGDAAPLTLNLDPSVRLLRSRYAICSLWGAHHGTHEINEVDPYQAETALTWRHDLEVITTSIGLGHAKFIESLLEKNSVESAIQGALLADASFNLESMLALLLSQELIATTHQPQQTESTHE